MQKINALERQLMEHFKTVMACRGGLAMWYKDRTPSETYGGRAQEKAVNDIKDFDLLMELLYTFHVFDTRATFDRVRAAGFDAYHDGYKKAKENAA